MTFDLIINVLGLQDHCIWYWAPFSGEENETPAAFVCWILKSGEGCEWRIVGGALPGAVQNTSQKHGPLARSASGLCNSLSISTTDIYARPYHKIRYVPAILVQYNMRNVKNILQVYILYILKPKLPVVLSHRCTWKTLREFKNHWGKDMYKEIYEEHLMVY